MVAARKIVPRANAAEAYMTGFPAAIEIQVCGTERQARIPTHPHQDGRW